ncbi:MAG: single-stranded DNA-binding protein [Planctomycetes bacterium]|nr:single-stranded DNA-binding protein [Planctomycetota bacterium]
MPGYNRVILVGNLTRDPELRYTPQGTAVADLSLAINTMRGRGSERKEDTVFVDVTVWDRQAETCNEYLSKGRPVLVEGRLRQDTWEDKETGQKRSKLRVTAQAVQFLGSTGRDSGGGHKGSSGDSSGSDKDGSGASLDEDFPEGGDVPF